MRVLKSRIQGPKKKIGKTYAGPSSGSLIEPTKDSWLTLNRWPITERITTPKAETIVQNQALPDYKAAIAS